MSKRFHSPSDSISLGLLLRKTANYTVIGLLCALALGGILSLYLVLSVDKKRSAATGYNTFDHSQTEIIKSFVLKKQRIQPRAMTKKLQP